MLGVGCWVVNVGFVRVRWFPNVRVAKVLGLAIDRVDTDACREDVAVAGLEEKLSVGATDR